MKSSTYLPDYFKAERVKNIKELRKLEKQKKQKRKEAMDKLSVTFYKIERSVTSAEWYYCYKDLLNRVLVSYDTFDGKVFTYTDDAPDETVVQLLHPIKKHSCDNEHDFYVNYNYANTFNAMVLPPCFSTKVTTSDFAVGDLVSMVLMASIPTLTTFSKSSSSVPGEIAVEYGTIVSIDKTRIRVELDAIPGQIESVRHCSLLTQAHNLIPYLI